MTSPLASEAAPFGRVLTAMVTPFSVDGGVDVDACSLFDEQPATASVSSAVNSATLRRYLRMPLNLCNVSGPG